MPDARTLVDTNVLLRILLGDVPAQRDLALSSLAGAAPASIGVLDAVLVETVFQLESRNGYAIPRSVHLPRLVELLHTAPFVLDPESWTALAILEEHPTLDYTDCLLLAHAKAHPSISIVSFDREVNRVARTSAG